MISDNEETDYEEPKPRPSERPRPHARPHHRRARTRHERDDKSTVTTSTKSGVTGRSGGSRATGNSRQPPPKTIKDVISPSRVNRYHATSFNAMKENLLQESSALNQNPKLRNVNKGPHKSPDEGYYSKQSESTPLAPSVQSAKSPTPVPSKSTHQPNGSNDTANTKTTIKTTTTVTSNGKNKDGDTVSTADRLGVREGNVYLDHVKTQVGLEKTRDDEPSNKRQGAPSRSSLKETKTTQNKDSSGPKDKSSKPDSRASGDEKEIRQQQNIASNIGSKPQTNGNTTVNNGVNISNTTQTTTKTYTTTTVSKSPTKSIANNKPLSPSRSNTRTNTITTVIDTKTKQGTQPGLDSNKKTSTSNEGLFLTQNDDEDDKEVTQITSSSKQATTLKQSELGSRATLNQGRSSVLNGHTSNSKQDTTLKQSEQGSRATLNQGRSSVVNGQAHHRKPSTVLVSKTTPYQSQASLKDPSRRPSVAGSTREPTDHRHMNGHVSPTRADEKAETKPGVASNKATDNNTDKRPPERSVNDAASKTSKSTTKKSGVVYKKAEPKPQTRQSRSKTPVRKQPLAQNGDIKMNREEYESMNQNKAKKPSGRRSKSPKTRKRSNSGGKRGGSRKRSTSGERARNRSTSREQKTTTPTASRFPDIVSKAVAAEKPPESPKPAANQWRDLVNKYMRQPSPKIGRTDDRSLLDSNLDTDDEEDDIFTRMTKRYHLSVDSDSDPDL